MPFHSAWPVPQRRRQTAEQNHADLQVAQLRHSPAATSLWLSAAAEARRSHWSPTGSPERLSATPPATGATVAGRREPNRLQLLELISPSVQRHRLRAPLPWPPPWTRPATRLRENLALGFREPSLAEQLQVARPLVARPRPPPAIPASRLAPRPVRLQHPARLRRRDPPQGGALTWP